MEIIEVNATVFGKIIPQPYYTFGSAEFANLNQDKADAMHYLLFKDGKYRLGLIGGIREKTLHSPFSAPFGGFVFLNEAIKIPFIDEALKMLINWANKQQVNAINVTLPPPIYQQNFIAKQANAFYRAGFKLNELDLNYAFHLHNFNENYLNLVWRNARKNLQIAFKHNLKFKKCDSDEEKRLVYEVISKNRETKGIPLRMSWEQVQETMKIIQSDFFLAFDVTDKPIASAIVFHISDNIVRIIYWGDIPEFSSYRTMNFLAYKIFGYYKNQQIKFIDIGISTVNSIPNSGLCEFKESIGCDIQTKMNFIKRL